MALRVLTGHTIAKLFYITKDKGIQARE